MAVHNPSPILSTDVACFRISVSVDGSALSKIIYSCLFIHTAQMCQCYRGDRKSGAWSGREKVHAHRRPAKLFQSSPLTESLDQATADVEGSIARTNYEKHLFTKFAFNGINLPVCTGCSLSLFFPSLRLEIHSKSITTPYIQCSKVPTPDEKHKNLHKSFFSSEKNSSQALYHHFYSATKLVRRCTFLIKYKN